MRRCRASTNSIGATTPVLDSHLWADVIFWLMTEPYRVFVVVDREYGARLTNLVQTGPVWIIDSPANHAAAQQIWAVNPNPSHLDGVTAFKLGEDSSSEDILIDELETIDLHHGTCSADHPYTVLEVIGTVISMRLKIDFSKLGFNDYQETSQGFRARRPTPTGSVASCLS